MGDLLREGCQWLAQQRGAHCASQVTYRRGADEAAVAATVGRTAYELIDEHGIQTRAEATDFLVAEADLPFGEPIAGDRIGLDGRVYEVMALPGEGCWRYGDPHHVTVRVHAKQVNTESA